jgi:hypothetical protein
LLVAADDLGSEAAANGCERQVEPERRLIKKIAGR